MTKIDYRLIEIDELKIDIFDGFNRYQDVKKCWRKEENKWVLKDIAFVEEWNTSDYEQLIEGLINTLKLGGFIYGGFIGNRLVGFVSIEKKLFGSKNQYIQLSELYVSSEERGLGIGKKLFLMAGDKARALNGKKLYISAHSSEESQKFYAGVGCVEALEYDKRLTELEPCDCQMEFVL